MVIVRADLPPFDITVVTVLPEEVLRKRLTARWNGYGVVPGEVTAKVEGNDLPHGCYVRVPTNEGAGTAGGRPPFTRPRRLHR